MILQLAFIGVIHVLVVVVDSVSHSRWICRAEVCWLSYTVLPVQHVCTRHPSLWAKSRTWSLGVATIGQFLPCGHGYGAPESPSHSYCGYGLYLNDVISLKGRLVLWLVFMYCRFCISNWWHWVQGHLSTEVGSIQLYWVLLCSRFGQGIVTV